MKFVSARVLACSSVRCLCSAEEEEWNGKVMKNGRRRRSEIECESMAAGGNSNMKVMRILKYENESV